jgi:tripeptidyl-peptidase-1
MALKLASYTIAFAAIASALSVPVPHVLHEARDTSSERWIKRGRVPSYAKLPVRVGLAQNNLDNGHEYLLDVAHPDSPNYGKHWTAEEVIDTFKPTDEAIETVRNWLVDSGIGNKSITHTANKAWLAFDATAKQLESLLRTEYHEFEDTATGGVLPACDRYHIPSHVQKHVDYITPGIKLMAPMEKPQEHEKRGLTKRQWPHPGPQPAPGPWPPGSWPPGPWPKHHWPSQPIPDDPKANLSQCDVAITPACIAALYNIPEAHLADPSNSMGIFEAELQYWDQMDLNLFFTNFTRIPNGTHPMNDLVDGGVAVVPNGNISLAGGEAMLDLDMAYPISTSPAFA